MGSRSSRSTRKSRASLTSPSCQARKAAEDSDGVGPTAVRVRRYGTRPWPPSSFPDRFLWGTATAAHQIEGGNVNNDWWAFEHDPSSGCLDVSGDACDSFNRYPEDIALVAGLGLAAYRFSLEWSRIEPEEGEFSPVALDHYRPDGGHVPRTRAPARGHLPPLHPSPLAGGLGDLGGPPRPRPLRPLLRTGHRPPGRPHRHGLHPQRAQRGGHHGMAPRALPAPGAGPGTTGRRQPGAGDAPTARRSRPSGRVPGDPRWA